MSYTHNVVCLDGNTMIEMNNLAVGYFPSDAPHIGIYPPLVAPPIVLQVPPITVEAPPPAPAQAQTRTNS